MPDRCESSRTLYDALVGLEKKRTWETPRFAVRILQQANPNLDDLQARDIYTAFDVMRGRAQTHIAATIIDLVTGCVSELASRRK